MAWQNFVKPVKLEEYSELLKEHIMMERRNGIIMLSMHTNGGPAVWASPMHGALPQAFHYVGNDPENEVMILTGTGSSFIGSVSSEFWERDQAGGVGYDEIVYDGSKLVENLLWDLDIPTIGVLNGPTRCHTELATMCDITICADTTTFYESHFPHHVPGDGNALSFQHIMGTKRAAYYMYTGKSFDAQAALEMGLVSEVLPLDKVKDRAWEIAETIMKAPRVVRRLTSQVAKRPWQRVVMDDFKMGMVFEAYGARMEGTAKWGRVGPREGKLPGE
ncbi:MAG: enoyl-CoA hydratase/isomerase family protein [Chloroflexi bacterium]|nr:enoyl-CoA hydratase/isomerase family protein [Chloroflexota bacterium]